MASSESLVSMPAALQAAGWQRWQKLFRIIEFTFAFTALSFDCAGAAFSPIWSCSPAGLQRNSLLIAAPQHGRAAPQKPSQQPPWLRPCSKGDLVRTIASFASIAGPPPARQEAGCQQLCSKTSTTTISESPKQFINGVHTWDKYTGKPF